jgi:hypothetical protein
VMTTASHEASVDYHCLAPHPPQPHLQRTRKT